MNHYQYIIQVLPDPEEIISDSIDVAWNEVLAWSAAATGILLTIMLVKSFLAR